MIVPNFFLSRVQFKMIVWFISYDSTSYLSSICPAVWRVCLFVEVLEGICDNGAVKVVNSLFLLFYCCYNCCVLFVLFFPLKLCNAFKKYSPVWGVWLHLLFLWINHKEQNWAFITKKCLIVWFSLAKLFKLMALPKLQRTFNALQIFQYPSPDLYICIHAVIVARNADEPLTGPCRHMCLYTTISRDTRRTYVISLPVIVKLVAPIDWNSVELRQWIFILQPLCLTILCPLKLLFSSFGGIFLILLLCLVVFRSNVTECSDKMCWMP